MQEDLNFNLETPQDGDVTEIKQFLISHWGSAIVVSKGKITDATCIPRIVCRGANGKIEGLLTYLIDPGDQSCEVISINSEIEGAGIGTRLIRTAEKLAKESGCTRIWLITTNDNPEAAAFYVKRGYRLTVVHVGALKKSRELKPQIPQVGKHGIPLMDEWEFEKII